MSWMVENLAKEKQKIKAPVPCKGAFKN